MPGATKARPEDIVDLKAAVPSVIIDIRYAGRHNFVGRPVPGYAVGKCLLTRRAAEALAGVQRELSDFGLSLMVYDCCRPQSAVDYFVKWAADRSDNAMKREFYPHVEKFDLLKEGYVAAPSTHSRGSTVDLTIVPLPRSEIDVYTPGQPLEACDEPASRRFYDGSLDMGTGYDCFDPRAHLMAPGLTGQQRANRMLLAALMTQAGFAGYRLRMVALHAAQGAVSKDLLRFSGAIDAPKSIDRNHRQKSSDIMASTESLFLSRPQLIPLLSLTGVVLDALGGLYLAYDLLGGKRGLLRLLSRVLTYSTIFGLGYGVTLGLWFGLAGALISGPSVEYQLLRRAQGIDPSRAEWLSVAISRGLSFGIAGWLTVGHDFGIAFGVLCTLAMHVAYEFGFGTNVYRAYQRPELHRGLVLPGFVRGILMGVAGAVSGALTGRPQALRYGVQIGVVVGALNSTVTILSPSVEWWADNLPDRALGGYGAVLVLIGSALQTVQYFVPLIPPHR